MIAVRFSLGDELAGTDTRIEIVTRCQLDVEIAADFAADAQGCPVEIRVIDRLDQGLLAVANRTKQVARFADEGGALFRRDDAVFPIVRVDQQIVVVNRGIQHLGFRQVDFSLGVQD